MEKTSTINALAAETGSSPRSIGKWLTEANLKPRTRGRLAYYDTAQALAVIQERQHGDAAPQPGNPYQRKLAAQARLAERKDRIEQALEARTYMRTETVERMITMGIQKLELVPVKFDSEFGLPEKQMKRLTELFDEARTEFARGLEAMDTPDAKTVL